MSKVELYDLTLPLSPRTPVHPGDPEVRFTQARSHANDGYQVTQISLGSHTGTHLDAPRHFLPRGATLDEYPLERLVGPGVVVDCRPGGDAGPTMTGVTQEPLCIDAAHLSERMAPFRFAAGGIVILWTEGALLTSGAAEILMSADPGLVGTDSPSLDCDPYPVHQILLGRGILIAENLHGLDRLGPGPATFAFLPLALLDTDGAPVRAIAWR
ncbi:MAG: cyclase family protein [Thermoleophilia bacterium]|nr:cyclase family protein [Thermoleophilia bacterium]